MPENIRISVDYDNLNSEAYEKWLAGQDVFSQQKELKRKFRNNKDTVGSGYLLESQQKALLRDKGILNWASELAVAQGTDKTLFKRYTRMGNGTPQIREDGPEPIEVDMPQNGMSPNAQNIFRYAYYKSMSVLESELDSVLKAKGDTYRGPSKEEMDRVAGLAWLQVAPAFRHLGLTRNVEANRSEDISASHQEILRRYVYAKNILKMSAPTTEVGGEYSHNIPFAPFPISDAVLERGYFSPEGSVSWDTSPEGIIKDLYLGSHWLVSLPGFAGQKRLIPRQIPFGFASEMTSTDIEFWMGVWQDVGASNEKGTGDYSFKEYLHEKIYEDKDSNISVYLDLSKTGEGLSFFYRPIGSIEGVELEDSLLTWSEWGDFMSSRASYNALYDFSKWFDRQEDWFNDVPIIKDIPGLPPEWFQLSNIEKLLSIIKDNEDTLESDPKKYRLMRSVQNDAFIDRGTGWTLFSNKLGINPDPSKVDFRELQRWWIGNPILRGLISTSRGFGMAPSEWRDEINWAQELFGLGTQIGHIEKQAFIKVLTQINAEYPNLENFKDSDMRRIVNEQMGQYVVTEADMYDSLASNASAFGLWASKRLNILRKKTYTHKSGTGKRANPNRPGTKKE